MQCNATIQQHSSLRQQLQIQCNTCRNTKPEVHKPLTKYKKIKPDWQPWSKSKCCPPNCVLKFIFLMFYELANNINIKSSQSNPEGTDQNQALLLLQSKLYQSLTFHKAWFSLVVCTNCPHSSKDTFSCHCQTEHDMKYLRTSRYQAQNVDSGRKVKAKRRMQWFKSKQWIVCPKTI